MMHNSQSSETTWRILETVFFLVLVTALWTLDTLTKFNLRETQGGGGSDFQIINHQVTSAIAVLLLIPVFARLSSRLLWQRETIVLTIAGHLLGSGLFAFLHYFFMVGMRAVIYPLYGQVYLFSDLWVQNLIVEYQKDLKIYIALIGIVSAYRYYRQQEADKVSTRPDRLIVQTGTGETVILQNDIEYLEAARNYVVVGASKKEYLVRDTLARLEEVLASEQLVRTHRSYLVNLDYVQEMRTTGNGGQEIRMQSGKRVPLSRGYRDAFRARLTS